MGAMKGAGNVSGGLFDFDFERKRTRASVYRREELEVGSRLRAPCIVTEYSGTTLIPDGAISLVDRFGNLSINAGGAAG